VLLNELQPNFGASLQILKVEIGGDAQSSGLIHFHLSIVLKFSTRLLFAVILLLCDLFVYIVYL